MSSSHKVAIIGSGPAGFTAALYASRAGFDVTILEGEKPGGQLMITTDVENYPGYADGIMGPEMMEIFRKQAHRFGAKSKYEHVNKVSFERPFKLETEQGNEYTADAVIIATGASAKLLGAKGEDTYMGYGVSACATCDGFFFKNQELFVVGGGDTAMEEATFLTKFASKVTIVHRRQEFRASKIMLDRARKNPKIDFLLDTVIDEFKGSETNGLKKLETVVLRDVNTDETREQEIGGVFIGIGHRPNSDLFKGVIDTDDTGYILTKPGTTYTNIPGMFACGDVQDSVYRQAVTAAGSGCMAAIDAERWLEAQEG